MAAAATNALTLLYLVASHPIVQRQLARIPTVPVGAIVRDALTQKVKKKSKSTKRRY